MDLKKKHSFTHSLIQFHFYTRVEKLGDDLVSGFSSTVLSFIVGMMICVVVSMSSEFVFLFAGEGYWVVWVVTVSEFAGPKLGVSEEVVSLSVFVSSVVREGVTSTTDSRDREG